ncbi:MAG: Xaa-Pro peptidase family protein [Armatimonadota bacterium]|nr:Xaa-Pro peptidase family protein [Armatimonadota bacterium]MDR5703520.1 Xaa-Pro peptidase family protein [Armatimonadota bacterium]MDR7435015.1 Xaa-Pro peptidase family protein [Armatimonadota bacterium]
MPGPFHFEEIRSALDQGQHFGNFYGSPYFADAVYEKFSEGEMQRRYTLTREKLQRLGLDALIACGGPNHWSYGGGVFWLTGHREWHAVSVYLLVPLEGEPTLVYGMGGTHIEATRRAVTVRDVRPASGGGFAKVLAARLRELHLDRGRIGISLLDPRNGDYLPVNQYQALLEELPNARFVFAGDFFHEFLVVKSREELGRVRKAGELCTRALHAILQAARPGVAEYELKAAAAHAILSGGGEVDFLIIGSTSMERPCMIFGNPRPSGRRLQHGDLILNELAAGYEGYTAQIGVPICVGPPTDQIRRMFDEVVRPGFEYLADALRPGVSLEEVARRSRFFRERGYQSRPIILHGIDLVTHPPEVRVDGVHADPEDRILRPGMTVMLEPNPITPDGLLGLFFGHTFVITETGSERVTGDETLDLLVAEG